jgi:NAD(P)H-dependent FMN reductase
LQDADLIIISFAEHNGTYTVIFKNLFDWVSRVSLKMFENKKLFLLSTAPGPRGGVGVLEHALSRFPRHGGDIVDTFTLPEFNVNFKKTEGIVNEELKNEFTQKVNQIQLLFS